jgi:hypothetical protein
MKRFTVSTLLACLVMMGAGARPACAYYDDVHYGFTYYVARLVGYTPEQAWRLASACVRVDAGTNETEPVQMGNILEALIPLLAKSPDLAAHAKDPRVAAAAESQWRFHAFRDIGRFPNSFGRGPQAGAADRAIEAQQRLLYEEAVKFSNPGIFLHFFQDRVPHGAYTTPGGHWVLPPDVKENDLPIGSTTDWLSFRAPASNIALARDTAMWLSAFMRESSKHQKALDNRPDFEALVAGLASAMCGVNVAPRSLVSMQEVVAAKYVMMATSPGTKSPGPNPATPLSSDPVFLKHAHGPVLPDALAVVGQYMARAGMTERVIPPNPFPYTIKKNPSSSGAFIVERDRSVLFCSLRVRLAHPNADLDNLPSQLTVTIWSTPTQSAEKLYELDKTEEAKPKLSQWRGETPFYFNDMPIGTVTIEVKSGDKVLARNENVELGKLIEEKVISVTPKETLKVPATDDPGGVPLIPEGMRVMRFGQRSIDQTDGWVPFRFAFTPPPGGVEDALFVLMVQPIGQLIDTDSFYSLDSLGKGVELYSIFETLPTGKLTPLKVYINAKSHPDVIRQLNTGLLRCCLQDDTSLLSALLIVNPPEGSNPGTGAAR